VTDPRVSRGIGYSIIISNLLTVPPYPFAGGLGNKAVNVRLTTPSYAPSVMDVAIVWLFFAIIPTSRCSVGRSPFPVTFAAWLNFPSTPRTRPNGAK
jgi:hypothetical protein